MIYNTIFSSPHNIINDTNNTIIYTNTINDTMNRRYCILRSELVILLEHDSYLEKECQWLNIPCIIVKNITKLEEISRVYIFSKTLERHTLNDVFNILKPIAEKKDITIFSEGENAAGTLVAKAIKERIK